MTVKELCILQLFFHPQNRSKAFANEQTFFISICLQGLTLLASSISLLLRKELKSFFAIFRSSSVRHFSSQKTFIFNCVLNLLCHHKVKVTSSNMHVMLISVGTKYENSEALARVKCCCCCFKF